MPDTVESVLIPLLVPGEELFWSGRPLGGIVFRSDDIAHIPFSLLWGGFAVFWEVMVLTKVLPTAGAIGVVFALFGLPFVAIGLYLIFGRFIMDARRRVRTYYGVTNQRILIVVGPSSPKTMSLLVHTLADVSMTERSDGRGTITFGSARFPDRRFTSGSWPGEPKPVPSFELIESPREVYDIIRYAQRTASAKTLSREKA